ncbi:MAG TPA: MFS transporter [Opitutaceae bacterium]|nr:MFS transporter [Opitutaceae bacterium]
MATPDKLSLREKLCYGCGDFASCLFWAAFSTFLFIFYTDVFGISAAAAGTLLLVTRIFDAVVDPVVGMIADRTETRWGKFRPYLLWFCIPYAVIGVMMFTTPNLGPTPKLIWAYVTYCGMMAVYTAINIPYTSLMGVISSNPIERTTVSSFKFVFAFAAGLIVKFSLPHMTKFFGASNPAMGWTITFVIIGAVAVVFFLITFVGTKERVHPPHAQKTSVGRDLKDLFTNGPWLVLLAATVTFIVFVAVRSTIMAHYLKYFVGAQQVTLPWNAGPRTYVYEDIISVFGPAGDAGAILGVLLVGWFAGKVGKKTAFISLFTISLVLTLAFYWLRPDQLFWLFLLQFLGSGTGGPLSVLLWAMYADTADYGEWRKGRRATGLVFSASTMSQKAGWAVGGVIVGYMLDAAGFIPNVTQSANVLHGLVLLMSVIPTAIGVVALVLFCFYPLNEKKMQQIEATLKARRLSEGAAAPGAG